MNNILITGVPHSGTTILMRTLVALGFYTDAEESTNLELTHFKNWNRQARNEKRIRSSRLTGFLDRYPSPWVIKDPLFIFTLEYYHEFFKKRGYPLLLWMNRNTENVAASFKKRGESVPGETVSSMFLRALEQFDRWPGPKLEVNYEKLKRAAGYWQADEVAMELQDRLGEVNEMVARSAPVLASDTPQQFDTLDQGQSA